MTTIKIICVIWVYLSIVSTLILIWVAERTPPAKKPEIYDEGWYR